MSSEQSSLTAFLSLSKDLTGFSSFELQGTGEAQAYLDTLQRAVGASLADQLMAAHSAVTATGAQREVEIRRNILSDATLGPMARAVLMMWYSGTWYGLPESWVRIHGNPEAGRTFTVRPSSYAEGLIWKNLGVNPAGAKAQGYGSWALPPNIPDPDAGLTRLTIHRD